MLPYWLLFSIYALGAMQTRNQSNFRAAAPPLFWVAAFLTAIMIGFRYETGGDWPNYMNIFVSSRYIGFGEILAIGDPAYIFLNWLAQQLDYDIWFVNLVCGLIFMWGLVRFAELQPNPWLAVAVAVPYLIIVVVMGYTRQGVAIGLLMAGLAAFQRGSLGRFIAYAIIAAAFHKSAIVVLPLVALAAVRNRLLVWTVAAGLGFLLFTVFLDLFLSQMMTNYFESQMESDGTTVRVAMNVLPAILYLLYQKRFVGAKAEQKLWRNFSLAALATVAALSILPSTTLIDRVALYLIPLQIFVLARLPYAFLDKGRSNSQLILGVLIYSGAILFTWLTQATHAHAWLPFRLFPTS